MLEFTSLTPPLYACRRYGRKATMIAGGACFLGGTVLVTLAIHMAMLVLGRLVLGVGVGFATQVSQQQCGCDSEFIHFRGTCRLCIVVGQWQRTVLEEGSTVLHK
jgi:hypothetical protein